MNRFSLSLGISSGIYDIKINPSYYLYPIADIKLYSTWYSINSRFEDSKYKENANLIGFSLSPKIVLNKDKIAVGLSPSVGFSGFWFHSYSLFGGYLIDKSNIFEKIYIYPETAAFFGFQRKNLKDYIFSSDRILITLSLGLEKNLLKEYQISFSLSNGYIQVIDGNRTFEISPKLHFSYSNIVVGLGGNIFLSRSKKIGINTSIRSYPPWVLSFNLSYFIKKQNIQDSQKEQTNQNLEQKIEKEKQKETITIEVKDTNGIYLPSEAIIVEKNQKLKNKIGIFEVDLDPESLNITLLTKHGIKNLKINKDMSSPVTVVFKPKNAVIDLETKEIILSRFLDYSPRSFKLTEQSQLALKELSEFLKDNPDIKISIEVFSGINNYERNISIQKNVGQEIKNFLIKEGVKSDNILLKTTEVGKYKTNKIVLKAIVFD